jgi:hypothetical protein
MAIVPLQKLQPPSNEAMTSADGQLTQAWQQHFQRVSDQTKTLADALHTGTTTNDNAAAGLVGEYIEATFADTGLTSTAVVDLGSLSLTAGDWDVRGLVTFTNAAYALRVVRAWVSQFAATPIHDATITQNSGGFGSGTSLWAGPVRISLAATTAVRLGTSATFPTGPASASGFIAARRVR